MSNAKQYTDVKAFMLDAAKVGRLGADVKVENLDNGTISVRVSHEGLVVGSWFSNYGSINSGVLAQAEAQFSKRGNAVMTASRAQVYAALDSERAYETEGKHSLEEWFTYMEDYINEAKHILSREASNTAKPKALDIMRKVAGMGVCAMEQHGAPHRQLPPKGPQG
jgi:hypothetical protein